jgi:ribulose-5-phosphate 4-epimerase/fuculose-1-phosphate aldolase
MASASLIADLVVANHILYNQGVVDGFGHVSVRDDQRPDRFWLARSMAPSLVQAEDILEYDLESTALNANGRRSYVERFIHGEVYRNRPDVMAVVHDHSPAVIPFGVSTVPLRPVFHMSGFLRDVKKFDIRAASGQMTDMLIRNHDLGHSLAMTLGNSPVALMRGHGVTVVGATLKEAIFRAVYTEVNARVQTQAITLGGPVEYLAEQEAELAETANRAQHDRPWELWKLQAIANRQNR